jgi:hypothetical protein
LRLAIVFVESTTSLAASAQQKAPVDELIPWLLDEDRQLRGIPFSEVIFDTTGKRVLPIDRRSQADQRDYQANQRGN